jgi:hypothetical protein
MNVIVKEQFLISRLELLDLDSLIVPSLCSLLVGLGDVVSLLPPFIQFS